MVFSIRYTVYCLQLRPIDFHTAAFDIGHVERGEDHLARVVVILVGDGVFSIVMHLVYYGGVVWHFFREIAVIMHCFNAHFFKLHNVARKDAIGFVIEQLSVGEFSIPFGLVGAEWFRSEIPAFSTAYFFLKVVRDKGKDLLVKCRDRVTGMLHG